MNNNPCQVTVTEWSGFYDKITLEDNKGKTLLESSKSYLSLLEVKDCIKIVNHGQTAEVSSQSVENADQEVLAELFPFVPLSSEEDKILNIQN